MPVDAAETATAPQEQVAGHLKETDSSVVLGGVALANEFRKNDLSDSQRATQAAIAQHVVQGVADSYEAGRFEEAKHLANALAAARPDYEVAVKLRDALADETLDDSKRSALVAGQANLARDELDAAIKAIEREQRLRRVLHPELLALLAKGDQGVDHPLVTVLVTEVNDKTTKALAEAGLLIEAASSSLPLVVGKVAIKDLEAIAMIDGVVIIEPTRMRPVH